MKLEFCSTDWTYPNGISSHKGGDTKLDSGAVSTHCSLEPFISLSLLCFFFSFPLQNGFLKNNQKTQIQNLLSLSWRLSDLFLPHTQRRNQRRVLLMAELILGGLTHLSLANLWPSFDVLWFGSEKLCFFTSRYLKQQQQFWLQKVVLKMEGLCPMQPLPGTFSFSHCFHYLRDSKDAKQFWT